MWDWINKNIFTKKVLGVAVGVVGVFYPPILPVTTALGGIILGSDFQHGTTIGTPIGNDAKELVKQVRAVLPEAVTAGASLPKAKLVK